VATAVEPAEEALAEPFVEQAPAIAAELR